MAPTTSDLIVERLLQWGVDTYFGLPGDGINGFFESLRQHQDQVRFIHMRHEEAAALAAVGYAKFTGKPAVCVTTSGPGAIHLLNGLYDAKLDEAPLIAITGMQYHDVIGTRFLQDINQDYVFNDACWFNQRVMGPAHAVNVTDLAVRTALDRRGQSHIAIPVDIQGTELSEESYSVKNPPGHTSVTPQPQVRVPPREELERAAEVLNGARNIAICAGAEARGATDELEQVAETLGAPIVKAGLGKDCVPDDSPYITGGLGLIVWEQMAFLGNPQHGCEIPPIDFAKVAEAACGVRGVRIEDPATCREQLEEGLSYDGPALIEAVVDPNEPPFGETLKPEQAENIATAFQRGEKAREPMANNLLEEDRVRISPSIQAAKDQRAERPLAKAASTRLTREKCRSGRNRWAGEKRRPRSLIPSG